MLQYNKLYQSLKKVSADWHGGHVQWYFVWDYLLFFEDGTFVQGTLNSENFEKFVGSFLSKNSNLERGKFIVIENEIKLSGIFELKGEVLANSLILQTAHNWELYTLVVL
jgi:hypothetical protein